MIVVSDTTPLHYLILIDAAHVLPPIFGRVYAPRAVMGELTHANAPEVVRAWAGSPPAWLTVQDPERLDPTIGLGPGEVAAISLALELKAGRILIDERKGYKAARTRGLLTSTTLGVIEEASFRNLIEFEATIDRLVRTTNFYLSDEVLEEYKRQVRARRIGDGA